MIEVAGLIRSQACFWWSLVLLGLVGNYACASSYAPAVTMKKRRCKICGKIVDSRGSPVRDVTVVLFSGSSPDDDEIVSATTNKAGVYEFYDDYSGMPISSGKYLIKVGGGKLGEQRISISFDGIYLALKKPIRLYRPNENVGRSMNEPPEESVDKESTRPNTVPVYGD
ncbi:MAG: carboxypeptidase-like regulatory domain-containing protein [Myxococcales bacterium]|nr:carboxypeptidase-like regulatory domain-containing protein [Myxococcales bacterium]